MNTVPIPLVFQLMLGTHRERQQASFRLSRQKIPSSLHCQCTMKGRGARSELEAVMHRLQQHRSHIPAHVAGTNAWTGGRDTVSFFGLPGNWRELHDARELLKGDNYASGIIGGAQVGILCYRQSLSINSRIIPFPAFARMYRKMRTTRKGLGGISGYDAPPIGILMDDPAMQQDEISPTGFLYRPADTVSSVIATTYVGMQFGSSYGAGAVAGFVFWGREVSYDMASELARELIKSITDLKQAL